MKAEAVFGPFKSSSKKRVDALVNQAIGGQSVLFRLFRDIYKSDTNDLRLIELTFFELSVLTFAYLRFSKDSARELTLDEAGLEVLRRSIPSCGEAIELGDAVRRFQRRYRGYDALIQPTVSSTGGFDADALETLGLYMYRCVAPGSASTPMIQITLGAPLFAQFLLDHVDFVRTLDGA